MNAAAAADTITTAIATTMATAVWPPGTLMDITEEGHGVRIDMLYARADNFTGHVIYKHSRCALRPEAESCLRRAIAGARAFSLTLLIYDAYRPQAAQQALWDVSPNPDFVADPAKGSNHTRGVAVDLTLLDAEGHALDMGTPVDTMTDASRHFHSALPAAVQVNRMRLLCIMLEAGFVHYPHEWWHYELPNCQRFPLIQDMGLLAD